MVAVGVVVVVVEEEGFGMKFSLIFSPSWRVSSLAFSASSSSESPASSSPPPSAAAPASLSSLALLICALIRACSLSSSPRSCLSFFLNASDLLIASGLLSIHAMKIPPLPPLSSGSSSSTLHMPSRPKCFAKSVRLCHLVAF